jgi:hypothetical protein
VEALARASAGATCLVAVAANAFGSYSARCRMTGTCGGTGQCPGGSAGFKFKGPRQIFVSTKRNAHGSQAGALPIGENYCKVMLAQSVRPRRAEKKPNVTLVCRNDAAVNKERDGEGYLWPAMEAIPTRKNASTAMTTPHNSNSCLRYQLIPITKAPHRSLLDEKWGAVGLRTF